MGLGWQQLCFEPVARTNGHAAAITLGPVNPATSSSVRKMRTPEPLTQRISYSDAVNPQAAVADLPEPARWLFARSASRFKFSICLRSMMKLAGSMTAFIRKPERPGSTR